MWMWTLIRILFFRWKCNFMTVTLPSLRLSQLSFLLSLCLYCGLKGVRMLPCSFLSLCPSTAQKHVESHCTLVSDLRPPSLLRCIICVILVSPGRKGKCLGWGADTQGQMGAQLWGLWSSVVWDCLSCVQVTNSKMCESAAYYFSSCCQSSRTKYPVPFPGPVGYWVWLKHPKLRAPVAPGTSPPPPCDCQPHEAWPCCSLSACFFLLTLFVRPSEVYW